MVDQSSFLSSSTWLSESLSPLAATTATTYATTNLPLAPLKTERLLLPNHQSAQARALAYCARIDHVEIRDTVKINGNTHYNIQIFYKKVLSHIPTSTITTLSLFQPQDVLGASPDFVTRQRFSKFANLRHEMYFHANSGHNGTPCSFCASMAKLLSDGPTLPRLSLKLFHSNEAVSLALEGFVNAALMVTRELPQAAAHRSGKLCEGQREIPLLLEQFLKPADREETPISSQAPGRRNRKVTPASHA